MNIQKFEEVREAAYRYCEIAYTGRRSQRNEAQKMIADWVRSHCADRLKGSRYAVIERSANFGTGNHPDFCKAVDTIWLEGYEETEKTYRKKVGDSWTSFKKENIIGWLS